MLQQPQELDGIQKWSSQLTAAVNEREDGEKDGGRVRKADMGQQITVLASVTP